MSGRRAGRRCLHAGDLCRRRSDVGSAEAWQETDWTDPDKGPVRGIGQRVLLCGEDDIAVMDLGVLRFGA